MDRRQALLRISAVGALAVFPNDAVHVTSRDPSIPDDVVAGEDGAVELPTPNSSAPTPPDRTANDDGYPDRVHVDMTGCKRVRPYLDGRLVYGAFECDRREGWIRVIERSPDNFTKDATPMSRLTLLRGSVQWIVLRDGETAPDRYPG